MHFLSNMLWANAAAYVVGLVVLIVIAVIANPPVAGMAHEGRWLKPIKFFASSAIFFATLAWLYPLFAMRPTIAIIAYGSALCFLVENVLITWQAARGRRSHFNGRTPVDAAIFAAMGIFITLNTALLAWLFVLALRGGLLATLPHALAVGISFGLGFFVIGSLQGFTMAAGRNAHTVGGARRTPRNACRNRLEPPLWRFAYSPLCHPSRVPNMCCPGVPLRSI